MRKTVALILSVVFILSVFSSCSSTDTKEYEPQETVTDDSGVTHSVLYNSDYSARTVKNAFCEVVLDSEFSSGEGNKNLVQKWGDEIRYCIVGEFYESDAETVQSFFDMFTASRGFPDVERVTDTEKANLILAFVDYETFVEATKETINDPYAYGGATYWYDDDTNVIDEGKIYYNNSMYADVRTSVILEEIYNVLGASNDSETRRDSIIFQHSYYLGALSPMDEIVMKILYSPEIEPGMDSDEVSDVIDTLYY